MCTGANYTSNWNGAKYTSPDCDLVEGEYYDVECRDSYGDGWEEGYL